jgi:hypothetical protein
MFYPVLVLMPLKQCYVKESILSLLCLFSLFVSLSRVLVYMCSVVNIRKVMIKCGIARNIRIAECIDTQTVIWVYDSAVVLLQCDFLAHCILLGDQLCLYHKAQGRGTYEAENCALRDYYTASSDNFLLTFRDSLSVPSSGFKNPKESI